MIDQLINSNKEHFDKVIQHFQEELATLRTGRANPGLLSTVMVESYGASVPLQQLASITVSDAKTLTVAPWDKSQMAAAEKGILAANLGLTPNNDGQVIRINLPPMTEERRKELVKLLNTIAEKSRITVRQVREDVLKAVKRAESDSQIAKDDVQYAQKKVQELVDEYNGQIKTIAEVKEKEIMTV